MILDMFESINQRLEIFSLDLARCSGYILPESEVRSLYRMIYVELTHFAICNLQFYQKDFLVPWF